MGDSSTGACLGDFPIPPMNARMRRKTCGWEPCFSMFQESCKMYFMNGDGGEGFSISSFPGTVLHPRFVLRNLHVGDVKLSFCNCKIDMDRGDSFSSPFYKIERIRMRVEYPHAWLVYASCKDHIPNIYHQVITRTPFNGVAIIRPMFHSHTRCHRTSTAASVFVVHLQRRQPIYQSKPMNLDTLTSDRGQRM